MDLDLIGLLSCQIWIHWDGVQQPPQPPESGSIQSTLRKSLDQSSVCSTPCCDARETRVRKLTFKLSFKNEREH